MQTFYRICFVCCLCAVCFCAGIASVFLMLRSEGYTIAEKKQLRNEKIFATETNEVGFQQKTADLNTKYYVRSINALTKEETIQEETLPQILIGSDRQGIESFITEYNKAPSLEDKEKGFVNAQLNEFSPEKIIVEKFYKPLDDEIFYLKAEENCVVVYYSDLSTVYMYTDIIVDTLSEETRLELVEGKRIVTLDSLYSFLESNTS